MTAAFDSLVRPRAFVVGVISVAALASTGYIFYRHFQGEIEEEEGAEGVILTGGGSGLHRSNAIRRRRSRVDRHGATSPRPSTSSSQDQIEAPRRDPEDDEDDGDGVRYSPGELETFLGDLTRAGTNNGGGGDGGGTGSPPGGPPLFYDGDPPPRQGLNVVNLLFRVSEDNSRRNASVHRGCQCNVCGIAPIRGVRYRCANCADFDLCESCESQGLHIRTHVFYKVKVPAPPPGLRQMQPVWYTGDPDAVNKSLSRPLIAKLARETGFERPELEAYWEQWIFMANTEWRDDPDGLNLAMDRKTFERCLITSGGSRHTAPNLLHDRMFAFYDTNKDGLIGFTEFLHGLSYRQRRDRLKKVFEGYDIDGDGYIDRRDCLRMFRAYYVLYKQMHKDVLEQLDEQSMSSTEVQMLAAGRQPISSLFGRDLHRMPTADPTSDRLQGKLLHPNGQVDLIPGRTSFVREHKGDVASRRAVLTRLFWGHILDREDYYSSRQYSNAVLGPVSSIGGLNDIIAAMDPYGHGHRSVAISIAAESGEEAAASQSADREEDGDEDTALETSSARDQPRGDIGDTAPEGGLRDREHDSSSSTHNNSHGHIETTDGQLRVTIRSMSPSMEREVKYQAKQRLYERWQRRQFYLDEQEGAKPPKGWVGEDDILARTLADLKSDGSTGRKEGEDGKEPHAGESSLAAKSPPSRSSSKANGIRVKAPADRMRGTRSAAEDWAGVHDIPDAERDAGKEIMYQIAQQAFNEMLDPLFKDKEDMALRVAETRSQRQKYADRIASQPPGNGDVADESDWTREDMGVTPTTRRPRDSSPFAMFREEIDEDEEDPQAVDNETHERNEEDTPAELADGPVRDPTMPQFRPNSDADESVPLTPPQTEAPPASRQKKRLSNKARGKKPAQQPNEGGGGGGSSSSMNGTAAATSATRRSPEEGGSEETEEAEKEKAANEENHDPHRGDDADDNGDDDDDDTWFVTPRKLAEWRRLNEAEREARRRGGFGRLDYREFEDVYKSQEGMGHRFDYLGSWIDFCIP